MFSFIIPAKSSLESYLCFCLRFRSVEIKYLLCRMYGKSEDTILKCLGDGCGYRFKTITKNRYS